MAWIGVGLFTYPTDATYVIYESVSRVTKELLIESEAWRKMQALGPWACPCAVYDDCPLYPRVKEIFDGLG